MPSNQVPNPDSIAQPQPKTSTEPATANHSSVISRIAQYLRQLFTRKPLGDKSTTRALEEPTKAAPTLSYAPPDEHSTRTQPPLGEAPTVTSTEATPAPTDETFRIPGYALVKPIGKGGAGLVYEATDALGQRFAVKLLRTDRLSDALRTRFEREAKAMLALKHERLVTLKSYHILEKTGEPYFVMPLYQQSLYKRLQENRPTLDEAVRLFREICEGMAYLHSQGRVHRDLKPGNILLCEAGHAHIADFGLIKELLTEEPPLPATAEDGAEEQTKHGTQLGTFGYMSEEQLTGQLDKMGPHWDVYALGVIFHELLTGERPNVGDSENAETFLNIPKNLRRIVLHCLHKDHYRNAGEVLRDVKRYQNRWRRRITAATAAVVLLCAVGVGVAASRPAPDPYAEVYKKLEAGEVVTLIDEKGMPKYPYKVHIEDYVVVNTKNPDEVCSIGPQGLALFELLPRMPAKEFKLSAELKIPAGDTQGRVGLFTGHKSAQVEGGTLHGFLSKTYREGGKEKSGRWVAHTQFEHLGLDSFQVNRNHQHATGALPPNATGWRKMEAIGGPNGTQFSLEGKQTQVPWDAPNQLSTSVIEDWAKTITPNQLPLAADGGIGIYVNNTQALIRNVVIKYVR